MSWNKSVKPPVKMMYLSIFSCTSVLCNLSLCYYMHTNLTPWQIELFDIKCYL